MVLVRFGPVSGVVTDGRGQDITPTRLTPVWSSHGQEDVGDLCAEQRARLLGQFLK